MNNELKKFYFEQKLSVVLPETKYEEINERSKLLAATLAANFGTYNFFLSSQAVDMLSKCDEKDIIEFYNFYMPLVKDAAGAAFEGRVPFYPGFPEEVIGKDRFDIFLDQLIYAFSGLTMMPGEKPKTDFFPYFEEGNKKQLNTGSKEDFEEYVNFLFKKPVILNEEEKKFITEIFKSYDFEKFLPAEPSKIKENNIFILQLIKDNLPERFEMYATKYLKTPTDVLRWAVQYVDGDISLNGKLTIDKPDKKWHENNKQLGFSFSKNKKYPDITKSLSKPQIREIMTLLNNTRMDIGEDYPKLLEDIKASAKEDGRAEDVILVDDAVLTYKQYYKSLAKVAHINPEAASTKTEKVLAAICDNKVRTINSLIEEAINDKDVDKALGYLKYRPTYFGKRLDKLCEIASETKQTKNLVAAFKEQASKMSISNLLTNHGMFESRKFKQPERIIRANGVMVTKEAKEPLSKTFCEEIQTAIRQALKEKYKDTKSLGKIYVDPSMANVKIPKNNDSRSQSKKLFPYTFGSSMPNSKELKCKQFGVAWEDGNEKNPNERVDIDLHSCFYDENGNIFHIGWNAAYSADELAVYSGDIQQGGSCEFVNCDLEKLREMKIPAVGFTIDIFCGAISYSDLLDCQFVLSERDDMKFGRTFEPKSVMMSMRPQSDTSEITPVVLNVETGDFIWLDAFNRSKEAGAIPSVKEMTEIIKNAIFENKYGTGFDVLLKAQNASFVKDIKNADIIFTQNEITDTTGLKEGVEIITQKDYDKLVRLLDPDRDEKAIIEEKTEEEIK